MTICRKINISVGSKGRNRILTGEGDRLPEFKTKPESGVASDYSDIAKITGLSRFMVTKMMSQLLLPTNIQNEILSKM